MHTTLRLPRSVRSPVYPPPYVRPFGYGAALVAWCVRFLLIFHQYAVRRLVVGSSEGGREAVAPSAPFEPMANRVH